MPIVRFLNTQSGGQFSFQIKEKPLRHTVQLMSWPVPVFVQSQCFTTIHIANWVQRGAILRSTKFLRFLGVARSSPEWTSHAPDHWLYWEPTAPKVSLLFVCLLQLHLPAITQGPRCRILGFGTRRDSPWGITWGCKAFRDGVGGLCRLEGAILAEMLDGVKPTLSSTQAFPHRSIPWAGQMTATVGDTVFAP